ncbi:MAG TPA: glycosyltransferase family 2 protein [Vicinamibacterales bacterium]|nr:glycosyltransferase family 2 protein [Vicinamibacterales bacterium]
MTPRIDIILVNYNTRDELLACLQSLHDAWPSAVANIVVVDNASTDDSVERVHDRFPKVGVIPLAENRGFGAANNVALRESRAEYVLFLNSDTLVPSGAIDGLLERLRAHHAVAAGPKLLDAQGRPEVSFGSMLTPATELAQRLRVRMAARTGAAARWYIERRLSRERLVDWVSGACLLVHRESAIAAHGFDERYFLYEEDVDLCAALRARGGAILYTPLVQITHLRGRSAGQPRTHATRPSHYDRSHLAFYEKHAPHWTPWLRRWLRWRGRI